MPVSDLQYRILAALPTVTMALMGLAVIAVIVFALRSLWRTFGSPQDPRPESDPLDRRFAAGQMTLQQYEQEKEKLLQAQ